MIITGTQHLTIKLQRMQSTLLQYHFDQEVLIISEHVAGVIHVARWSRRATSIDCQ